MNRLIEEHRTELARLCQLHRVRRLELFGSATGTENESEIGDLDFLVEFADLDLTEYADAYFGFLECLQDLFHKRVDLVMLSAVKNPYLLESIEKSRTVLYAA
ncbi:MAG TPA: nucleotidyltransferase domain-containing protein [Candidatus Obscuribacterales bacterium]